MRTTAIINPSIDTNFFILKKYQTVLWYFMNLHRSQFKRSSEIEYGIHEIADTATQGLLCLTTLIAVSRAMINFHRYDRRCPILRRVNQGDFHEHDTRSISILSKVMNEAIMSTIEGGRTCKIDRIHASRKEWDWHRIAVAIGRKKLFYSNF